MRVVVAAVEVSVVAAVAVVTAAAAAREWYAGGFAHRSPRVFNMTLPVRFGSVFARFASSGSRFLLGRLKP